MACRPQTTLEQLREAFPCKDINAYYWDNYYEDLFYMFPDEIDDYGEPCMTFTSNKRKGTPSLARWDFYLKEEQLLSLSEGKAIYVKLWRKGDFDRLLDYMEKHSYTDFISVEECL